MSRPAFGYLCRLLPMLVLASGHLPASEVFVAGPAQLEAALHTALPGDILTLKNGHWPNTVLTITKGGEAGRPVEVRAETSGGVILDGSSSLTLSAPYVTVDGLQFTQGTTTGPAVILFKSHHGVVRNTAIIDYNPAAFASEYYWVFFEGDHNLVERCYFKGKSNLQPLIGNAIDGSRHNAVTGSYFKNIPYVPNANGREIIRVWGSGKTEQHDDDGAYFLIEGNLFDHADGEGTEIISLKSNHNIVRRNTVIATRGGLNIRRGNFNTVTGNIILGQNRAGAQGLRMSGEHNVVQGNFVAGCEYGIRVACGEYIAEPLTPGYQPDIKPNAKRTAQVRIPTYPQVRDLLLADNVTVGISGPDLELGSSYKNHWPQSQQVLLPEDCLLKNNRFVRPHGGQSVLIVGADKQPPLDRFTFKPNRAFGNALVGGQSLTAPGVEGYDPQALSANWTEAQESAAFHPLAAEDVGPVWVISARRAGEFPLENTAAPVTSPGSGEPSKKKSKH